MAYGLPETVAVATAPGLERETLPIVSLFFKPVEVNSVPAKLMACPKFFVALSAVMTKAAGLTVSALVPVGYVML